jgi:mannose-6-phosphate isomerase-like protein (cupin superfamily)
LGYHFGMDQAFDLASTFVKFGPNGETEPVAITPSFWGRSLSSGPGDRFLGVVAFDSAADLHADLLERHPGADELLLVLEGALVLVIEEPGGVRSVELGAGDAYLVPCGFWHRLEMRRSGRLLFVNSRHRMESRLRDPRGRNPKQEDTK